MQQIKTHFIVLFLLSICVIIFQTQSSGFEKGHYAWVTSNALAQVAHATPDNYFLGYSLPVITEQGQPDYLYFDRYPVFFSALINRLTLPFQSDFVKQIYSARLIMNLLFIAMIFTGYTLLNLIFNKPLLSLFTVLTTFGSSTILFYRDMVHYDQPALLGILLLLVFIARYELHAKSRGLLLIALVASVMGRGYASFFILATWSAFRIYRYRKPFQDISVRTTLAAVAFASCFLAYNIYRESVIRNIPFSETSIVSSASSRLGITPMKDELERKARISKVAVLQVEGLYFSILPAVFGGPEQLMKSLRKMGRSGLGIAGLILILAFIVWQIRKSIQGWRLVDEKRRQFLLIIMISGPFWGIFMRKLTAFHQYTSMYLIPLSLVVVFLVYLQIEKHLNTAKKQNLLLGFLIVLFWGGLCRIQYFHHENKDMVVAQTKDMQNIADHLRATPKEKIYIEGGYRQLYPGAPFAAGYFLADHYLAPEPYAKYVISKVRPDDNTNLTPENQFFFLRLK